MLKNKKLYLIPSVTIVVLLIVFAINYFMLQRYMNDVLSKDSRNDGIKVWVHYKWFVNPTEIKYDLRKISGDSSNIDTMRVMLQFAEQLQNQNFKKVYLSYKGTDKFYFKGDYFQVLGKEYEFQNPIYTLRTMPENVYTLDGDLKYGSWEGGWLGVMNKQMDDLKDFSEQWYLIDMADEVSD
ncbi:hypothetical protein HLH17_06780 [Acinetobacter sp. ANC 5380]|uniref:Uncharacterized protein n=1 Tax=Acinetobacter terrae TaxID=2731247 RepID=A0A7Y2REU1_9GAMM|nr:hypothetical protein [Acinetobacter terrae]NNH77378.1 hypothetical protein [Acinetobacter terrae]